MKYFASKHPSIGTVISRSRKRGRRSTSTIQRKFAQCSQVHPSRSLMFGGGNCCVGAMPRRGDRLWHVLSELGDDAWAAAYDISKRWLAKLVLDSSDDESIQF